MTPPISSLWPELVRSLKSTLQRKQKRALNFRHKGFCPICEKQVMFRSNHLWFRDNLLCSGCGSIPRERALFHVLNSCYPNYASLMIHESSPCGRGASLKLSKECSNYSSSHYYPEILPGDIYSASGFRCENLESLTFADNSFDIFVTQDVMEHIFDPEAAFREIARVLKPGGAHIFTVPLVNKNRASERWAEKTPQGAILYHHEPEYHGNPIDLHGSLVTMHWGFDIADKIMQSAQTPTTIFCIDNLDKGIRAEYIEVVVSRKY